MKYWRWGHTWSVITGVAMGIALQWTAQTIGITGWPSVVMGICVTIGVTITCVAMVE